MKAKRNGPIMRYPIKGTVPHRLIRNVRVDRLPLALISIVLAVTLGLWLVGCGSAGLGSPASSVVRDLGPSVVHIDVSAAGFASTGSGVIYKSDGTIITNSHVVTVAATGAPVDKVSVTLATGEQLPATIVGRDPLTDVAVIKTNSGAKLPSAAFDTELPTVGDYAFALGSPLGFEASATMGIVSGLGRSIDQGQGFEALIDLIQTDAAISPGNSGGALGNARGHVIGINVAYIPPALGAVNLGFAIPTAKAVQVADEIIKTGKATHTYIGVTTATITPTLKQRFNLSESSGALIGIVAAGSPADAAGLRRGDIIIKMGDKRITSTSDVLVALRDYKAGDTIQVQVDRGGQKMVVGVKAEDRPTTGRQ